jgi:hypothetical protein
VKLTRKFWVQESDVSALMYFILQHLPLLPSTSSPVAVSQGTEQGTDGVSTTLYSAHQRQPQWQQAVAGGNSSQQSGQQQQQQQQRAGTGTSPPQLLQQPALGGFTTTLHTVYFDNVALQLYHGRLYLRPKTQTLKARWIGQGAGVDGRGAVLGPGWCPDKVVLERKIYREGWRGEGPLWVCKVCTDQGISQGAQHWCVVCEANSVAASRLLASLQQAVSMTRLLLNLRYDWHTAKLNPQPCGACFAYLAACGVLCCR